MKLQDDFASFIFLLLSIVCVTDGCHEERAALLNFKSFLADHSNHWSSWQGQNCCSRLGIRCSDLLHVIAVNLRNPNPDSFILNINSQLVSTSDSKTSTAVQGHIPAQIQGLGNIRFFLLSDNKLFGKIPLSFCGPDNVLLLLDLSNNMLVGRIPISVGNCTYLLVLNLGGNKLSGNIPNVLKAAKYLTHLELSDNHFDGPFPSFIQKLEKLEVLMLANYRLEGKIPRFIGDLKNLHILVLRSNSFNDSIPAEINKLEKLQFLDFSNN
ncbi:leucine-rich repeat receptor-like serine/threonine-protein kinase At1g17230 [Vitis riparia]|uniref:leucine-rich repeat receptor-like serine/threonine-protein kinase At1g17230 n=1 Tax=Vitis riparia TaxID=96939 RepID=UPI00155ADC4C|nr:leucine-rich repeat receptor-like serine/threonine-protein kinase At1g17230 [Vitis riparia]